jgi:hypothetical protein
MTVTKDVNILTVRWGLFCGLFCIYIRTTAWGRVLFQNFTVSQESLGGLWTFKPCYCGHMTSPFVCVLSQMNAIHTLTPSGLLSSNQTGVLKEELNVTPIVKVQSCKSKSSETTYLDGNPVGVVCLVLGSVTRTVLIVALSPSAPHPTLRGQSHVWSSWLQTEVGFSN